MRHARALLIGLYRNIFVNRKFASIRFSIKFYSVSINLLCSFNCLWKRVYKDGNTNTIQLYLLNYFFEKSFVSYCVPSSIRRNRIRRVRYERSLGRFNLLDHPQISCIRITFNIEFRFQNTLQSYHITKTDMSFILPWMNSDALCTKSFTILSSF